MSTDMVLVPRAAVAALVDPQYQPYIGGEKGHCNYCGRPFLGFLPSTPGLGEHTSMCPVRIIQDALKETP